MTPGFNLQNLPNLSRAQIQARLAQQAPPQNIDLGTYTVDSYDRASALSRLPGDDLKSIVASATKDAAECSKSGKLHLSLSLPTWIAGAASLLFLGAPVAGVATLAVGTIGMARGVQKFIHANHDKQLMSDIQRFAAEPDLKT